MIRSISLPIVALVLVLLTPMPSVLADDYTVKEGHKSFLCAVGCFWCGEQAFEQYAPGVTEAVSGYAGGTNDNPTYRNHPGHFEVVLVEYDPTKTSYELLVNYAWRNLDPFDGIGQFCDKGSSYRPAIFYANEEEKEVADRVRDEVLGFNNWTIDEIAVPHLERPKFWTAEGYHQDYYLKSASNYGFYKERCGRTRRLKAVWGEDEYKCYHDVDTTCFNMTVANEEGDVVIAETNIKDAPPEKVGAMPRWAAIVLGVAVFVILLPCFVCMYKRYCKRSKKDVS
mmetsp:Transcript_29439/g.69016  ORF Transcript_29439/g.69016 Transcript_29439/m.69016 type:complete len:283 (-) Transcript_29439:79-927(-)|eukprot:CAMPEP_0185812220 /NCGR_PEP_ID=MMETSP1322-20130828/9033_1 /TAXON_ID=265543 /ORGANISM="Minutocellus polymorphus, Strain RCC2270" /LENGTH=282 /DNA_ID=CAMNT_0028508737 /DNA_START=60 /DNA_END=908 /DNA_ORIENTATION=+